MFLNSVCPFYVLDSISIGRAAFGEGSNYSILLDQLMCTGNENSLLDCAAGEEVGSHNCDHSEDAGVRCEGIAAGHLLTSYVQNGMFHLL